jgi:magnesium transporter
LQTLPKRKQKAILEQMSVDLQHTVSTLLQFDPKTAAGLMSLNYIQVDIYQKLSVISEQIQNHEQRTGKMPVILVLEDEKLIGVLPVKELVFAKPGDRVEDFVKRIPTIKATADFESVINRFLDNPHRKMVVLGENNNILGVIYSDDVLRALQEKEASSLYDFAGVSNEETVFGSVKQKVRYRYKWLIINLATAFLASFTVSIFDETISKYVLLAVYMPIVAGMGGNAATQTLAVLVRGIALKQVELQTVLPVLRRELLAAFINGMINGLLVAMIVIIFNRDFRLAVVLAVAMIINLVVAGFFGTLVPLIMAKLKKDPATSATIFITTATDVLGFMAFLGIATMILR